MSVGWPEGIWFAMMGLYLLGAALLDGQPKRDRHSLSLAMLSAALSFGLLWWGGFFA